jgi:hypothetical protein
VVTGLLPALGLKQLDSAHVMATISDFYTRAQWVAANAAAAYSYFFDTATNGTKQAPLLVIATGAGELGNGVAVTAAAQVRIRFEGH